MKTCSSARNVALSSAFTPAKPSSAAARYTAECTKLREKSIASEKPMTAAASAKNIT